MVPDNDVHPEYDPFRRTDSYGQIGAGPLPLWRHLGLILRGVLLLPIRMTLIIVLVLSMWLVGLICKAVPALRGSLLPATVRFNARAGMLAAGILYIQHQELPDPASARTKRSQVPILVANHSSWMDILMVQWLYAASYVTRVETRKTPFIGGICDSLPCIYVQRDKSQAQDPTAQSTAAKIVAYARDKQDNPATNARPLCLFPEGTTTNGRFLLPFKTGAFLPGVPVRPLLLEYPPRRGNPALAWETITPLRHLLLVLCSLSFPARLVELPLYEPSDAERSDPKLFAENVRSYMQEWSQKMGMPLELSDSSFEMKKAYHEILKQKVGITKNAVPPDCIQLSHV